jgi:D-erythro-7,8-dihydroneopterin triphosphate epimerase
MDRIIIRDLRVRCIIGINDEERREKQDVIINIAIYADLSKAGKSDQTLDTIDYRALKKNILNMVEASHYFLIEALAQAIADLSLQNPAVEEVTVSVDKPYALRFARSVAVEITRKRKA